MNLKDKADKVFSLFIRNRDCPEGVGRCISCGKTVTPKTCDCGHFIPRQHTAARYDERNCAAQCYECNRMKGGNLAGFTIGLVERYGDGVIEELKTEKHSTVKLSESDFKKIIRRYGRLD